MSAPVRSADDQACQCQGREELPRNCPACAECELADVASKLVICGFAEDSEASQEDDGEDDKGDKEEDVVYRGENTDAVELVGKLVEED